MGYLSSLSSIGSKVKHYTKIGINKGRKAKNFIRKTIGNVNSFLDEILDIAHNMPMLIDLAQEFENNEIYQNYRGISQELDDVLADADVIFDGIERSVNMIPGGNSHVPHPLNPGGAPIPRTNTNTSTVGVTS